MWEYGIWDPEPSWGYGLERFHGDMETPELSRGYRDSSRGDMVFNFEMVFNF
jgi:hypothetical protein